MVLNTFWQNLRRSWQPEQSLPPEAKQESSARWDWVLPHKLAVGAFPELRDLEELKKSGFQSILTLCNPEEAQLDPAFTETFQCLQYSLPDSRQSKPLLVQDLGIAVNLLQQSLSKGTTYVHCLAGVERSPTVCVAYLCRYQNLQVWEALNWLKDIHSRTGITSEQLRVISSYLVECSSSSS
ncbi:MAG: dual specificity protein phosphatase family protein [Prochlorotrichaceae cyanobacterium]